MIVRIGELEFEILDEKDVELFRKLLAGSKIAELKPPVKDQEVKVEPKVDHKQEDHKVDRKEDHEKMDNKDRKKQREIPDGFIDAGFFYYQVDEDEGVLRIRTRYMYRVFDYGKIKELFEKLPEEAVVEDVVNVAKELGMNVDRGVAYMLMHFFSRYVDFDAELIKGGKGRGNKTKLIKRRESLGDEFKNILEIEKNVIGTPWGPSDYT